VGEIEIGGNYAIFVRRSPPGRYLEEHCLKNTRYHLYVASQLPELILTKAVFKPIAGFSSSGKADSVVAEKDAVLKAKDFSGRTGVLGWLDLEIKNKGVIPTATAQAIKIKAVRPDKLILTPGSGLEILGRCDGPNRMGRVENFEPDSKISEEIGYFDGRTSKTFRFLVKSLSRGGKMKVEIDSQRGGHLKETITINVAD
jgi:hypothetical protein